MSQPPSATFLARKTLGGWSLKAQSTPLPLLSKGTCLAADPQHSFILSSLHVVVK